MSVRVLTQGGGTGGASASIFITGLSSSDTVSAKKGSKTIGAKWNSTANRFEIVKIKEYGMWTVTATNGEETVTQDVLVDAAVEFIIPMTFWGGELYNAGNEYEEITGGWLANKVCISGRPVTGTATKEANAFYFNAPGYTDASFVTAEKISFTGFSTLYLTGTTSNQIQIQVHTSYSSTDSSVGRVGVAFLATNGTVSLDISSLQDSYYVAVGTGGARSGRATKIWLE